MEQFVIRPDEGPQGPGARTERVELRRRQPVGLVGPDEVREPALQFVEDPGGHRIVHPRPDLDGRGVEPSLPGRRQGDHDVATDQFRPVEVMADRRTEWSRTQAACLEFGDGALEDRDTGPRDRRRVGDDAVALGLDAEPVLQAAHHDRDDRSHVVDRQTRGLPAAKPALHRLAGRDGLRDAERHRRVDVHPPIRRFFHDPDADRGGRELDDDVRRERREVLPLGEHGVEGAEEGRVGLHREAALAAARRLEGRQEERRGTKRHLLDDGPREVDLGGGRTLLGEGTDPPAPDGRIGLPDVGHDRRVGGGADGAEGDRVLELGDGAGVVPDVGRRRGDRPTQWAVREREPGSFERRVRGRSHHPSSRSAVDTRCWRAIPSAT